MRWIAVLLLLFACSGMGGGFEGGNHLSATVLPSPPDPCDLDADGYQSSRCGGTDCNDLNAAIHPGAVEICGDGVDQDCDGVADQGCTCVEGERRACYDPGLSDPTIGIGACKEGFEFCEHGAFTPCLGEVTPTPEVCNGIDDDCNGVVDDGVANRCGSCGPVQEICGNGLDDDCNGVIDDPDFCSATCASVDPAEPGGRGCCLAPDHPTRSFECQEDPSLSPCVAAERTCLGGPSCEKHCRPDGSGAVQCFCGVRIADQLTEVPTCGFDTPCARLGCEGRTNQGCYSGPPQTLGKGICHGGTTSCLAGETEAWEACQGEVTPEIERCDNLVDDDCDGLIDEDDGTGHPCGRCVPGGEELCGNGLDDDCDGQVDEACLSDALNQFCYPGPPGTRGVGACHDGTQDQVGSTWGPCHDFVVPGPDICGDGIDSNCNGMGASREPDEPGCCVPSGDEVCNGVDDDCDGLVDEGLLTACGTCGQAPCFELPLDRPADCSGYLGRSCSGVTASGLDGEGLTLAPLKLDSNLGKLVAVGVRDLDRVAAFDPVTGTLQWEVDSQGDEPYAVAEELDGTIWVANRGFSGPDDPRKSNVVHLGLSGDVLCRAGIPGIVRAVTVDSRGRAWAGSFNTGELRAFDPGDTSGFDADGFPVCVATQLGPLGTTITLPGSFEDLAVDRRGILWTGQRTSTTTRLDTGTLAWDTLLHTSEASSVSLDATGNAWFGGGKAHRINADGPYFNPADYERDTDLFAGSVRVARDGTVYAEGVDVVNALDPDTLEVKTQLFAPSTLLTTSGIVEDLTGLLWTVADGTAAGAVVRLDPTKGSATTIDVEPGHKLTLRGNTGVHALTASGDWSQLVDSSWASTTWRTLSFESSVPAGALARVTLRFSSSATSLEARPPCGPFDQPGTLNLSACEGSVRARFVQVRVSLVSSLGGAAPVVSKLRLTYDR